VALGLDVPATVFTRAADRASAFLHDAGDLVRAHG
jgi:hypothetical protein